MVKTMRLLFLCIPAAAAGLHLGCAGESASAPQSFGAAVFHDVAAEAGITHRHHKPILDHKIDNIMPWMTTVGAAVAAGDFNADGWIDLYVTDSKKGEPNYLYRNQGDGTFRDVAPQAGLAAVNGDDGTSMDAVWGDFDNDGWIDLYLVRWGRDALFRSNGPGADGTITFTDVSESLFRRRDGSPGIDWANGNAAIFFDADRDGRLDIYVGNYFKEVDLWHLEDTRIMHDDFERARNGGRNFFYRQQADGTFTEVAAELGLDDPGWTLAVGVADLDGDGWPDLYCADDFGPDQLFLSNGGGTFRNVTAAALGYDTKKGMNVDFGDFNNDGWLDVYVTNITTAEYLQEGNMLWYNQGRRPGGDLKMTDISLEAGTYDGGWGWGAKFFDYDNDGDLDIVSANGFISAGEGSYWYDLASWTVVGEDSTDATLWPAIGDRSFSGYERTRLWRNDGLYSFSEESRNTGLDSTRDGRGIAVLDYDNDGDLDLFIANQGQAPHLYRNHLEPRHRWLMVALETDPEAAVNRDGIGTRVTVRTADGILVRERDGGNGYSAQSDPRLHFGLGDAEVEFLEVRWPDGGVQILEDVAPDRLITVRQERGRYVGEPLLALAAPSWAPSEEPVPAAPPEIEDAELDRQLSLMEERLTASFEHSLAGMYRARAATYGRHDRAIDFLEGLLEAGHGDPAAVRIELSLAYVDKIPACGGLAAIVCKGSLAKKGLNQIDRLLEEQPESWLAYYSRGMNHLHWPRALLHSEDAARDLERCVEIQASTEPRPYHQKVWLALGQAYAKAGDYDRARSAWRRGLQVFPEDQELGDHLAIADDGELLDYVLELRSLENPIDTDLSFVEGLAGGRRAATDSTPEPVARAR